MEERIKASVELMDDVLAVYRAEKAKPENANLPDDMLLKIASECVGIMNKEQRINRTYGNGQSGVSPATAPVVPQEVKCGRCRAVVRQKKNKLTGIPYLWCRNCDKKLNPDGSYYD